MATGYHANRARGEAADALGRELTRRSKAKCEMCKAAGVRLTVVEIPPVPETPVAERAALLCDDCRYGVEGGPLEADRWRFLEEAVWNDLAPVQVAAVRIARHLGEQQVEWARDTLSVLYLDSEIEAWLDE